MVTPDWKALRDELPTLRHRIHLDVARKTLPPRCQERAMQDAARCRRTPSRALEPWGLANDSKFSPTGFWPTRYWTQTKNSSPRWKAEKRGLRQIARTGYTDPAATGVFPEVRPGPPYRLR